MSHLGKVCDAPPALCYSFMLPCHTRLGSMSVGQRAQIAQMARYCCREPLRSHDNCAGRGKIKPCQRRAIEVLGGGGGQLGEMECVDEGDRRIKILKHTAESGLGQWCRQELEVGYCHHGQSPQAAVVQFHHVEAADIFDNHTPAT